MNYFIYHVSGTTARKYLQGTNYVGVWADTENLADVKVARHFASGTQITKVTKDQVIGDIGYLS